MTKGLIPMKNKIDRIAAKIARRGLTADSSPLEKRVARAMMFTNNDGGAGSGNFNHKGRPGEVGGSSGGSGSSSGSSETSDFGELTRTYPDGTKSYEKENVELTPEEHKKWMYAMESWVKSEAVSELMKNGYKRGDIDINIDRDKGTAFIKTWKEDEKSPSGLSHEYFDVKLNGTRRTSIKPDGKKRVDTFPDSVKLVFRGSELY